MGKREIAFESYEKALEREQQFPRMQTVACLDFPYLIATENAYDRFEQAISILDDFDEELVLMFPVDRFKYHTTRALILAEQDPVAARAAALAALDAAGTTDSGFLYHRSAGLVTDVQAAVIPRLRALCGKPSCGQGNKHDG